MKKILGISLVAALAVSPLMAFAAAPTAHDAADYNIVAGETGAKATVVTDNTATDVPEAAGGKYFRGKAVTVQDASKVATGAYVKGAYNATISAINKAVDDLEKGVVNTVKSSYVENVVTDAALTSSGVDALTAWGSDDTIPLGAAELSVTRQNVAVKVLNSGTEQAPVEYHQTAANLDSVVPGATAIKVTPGSAGWQTEAQIAAQNCTGYYGALNGTTQCWTEANCKGTGFVWNAEAQQKCTYTAQ